MQKILVLGAGRSSSSLIKYLLHHAGENNWEVTVGDISIESAQLKTNNHKNSRAILFDIHNELQRADEIAEADIVISLLPPSLHYLAARDCVKFKKNLVTASYLSPEIKSLSDDALKSGILILNECGLDPGIDHMSAMEIIDRLKNEGNKLISFKSYTGGLVAPESNDNPWGYKFSWNPRNVILAGQGTAKYIDNGNYKYIPYSRLFSETETIKVNASGSFDGYANRDSLAYRDLYGISDIPTLLRGTLRQQGFCSAWNVFVMLGLTDDSYTIEHSGKLTYAQLVKAFLPTGMKPGSLKEQLASFCNLNPESEEIKKIEWTGILEEKNIGVSDASPAQVLQHLLQQKWVLRETDKDMIVMQHELEYQRPDKTIGKIISSLVVKGEDQVNTAMAKTVGLPLAIATRLILQNKISLKGVHIPVTKEIYAPILRELQSFGIDFKEIVS